MIITTLNKIRQHEPCVDGWKKLLTHLGKTEADDEPLPFSTIIESNGLDDALWCCRVAPEYDREWRLFAVWCARQVQHLIKDKRSLNAIDVAEKFAHGLATADELKAAEAAARDAAGDAAWAAGDAARAAAWAAGDAAWTAAGDAAWAAAGAAGNAARAARAAAWAAGDAAWAAKGAAARAAAKEKQRQEFILIINQ